MSIEAEKDSNYRYSPISSPDLLNALGDIDEIPDVLCTGGWWPRDHYEYLHGSDVHAGYRGVTKNNVIAGKQGFLGKQVRYFSSTHERSHILCAFGMSSLPKGTPCYALVWEGAIGAFYEIDSELNITPLADVLNQAGNRYGLLYGLADPTFPKNGPYPRTSDAGKLMALASFSNRSTPSAQERKLLSFLLDGSFRELSAYEHLEHAPHLNVGIDDPEFRNFAGIYSDAIFDIFYRFAKVNLKSKRPLVIAGGCGLNCDWNSKWKESGIFTEVFVPPVANDSGSAIGTAIDAQFHFTGNPKIDWNVYSGRYFVNGNTRVRLNEIKQREQFRPIAPVCLEEDAAQWFGCDHTSPFMLYTYRAKTGALAAVTHVNGTARIQTLSSESNRSLHKLLVAFKARTGYGVLCNTSLNFHGKGFINKIKDLSAYAMEHNLDGFVIEGRAYLLKVSNSYQKYLKGPNRINGTVSPSHV